MTSYPARRRKVSRWCISRFQVSRFRAAWPDHAFGRSGLPQIKIFVEFHEFADSEEITPFLIIEHPSDTLLSLSLTHRLYCKNKQCAKRDIRSASLSSLLSIMCNIDRAVLVGNKCDNVTRIHIVCGIVIAAVGSARHQRLQHPILALFWLPADVLDAQTGNRGHVITFPYD